MDRYQKTGNYLVWTEGEYSDYSWNGLFRVLQDFDMSKLVLEWIDYIGFGEHAKVEQDTYDSSWDVYSIVSRHMDDMRYKDYANSIEFFPYLIREGYLEEVDVQECRTGSYGDFTLNIRSE